MVSSIPEEQKHERSCVRKKEDLMACPSHSVRRFISWIAKRFGFVVELADSHFMDPLNDQDVFEQLQYGRD